MNKNYLIAVFIGGKNVNLYFSDNLDDLITVRALYKGGEIEIFDLRAFGKMSREQVESEIAMSRIRWKVTADEHQKECEERKVTEKPRRSKVRKYWERRVLCVETGQVFGSIRECSDHLGIPYTTIANCIKNGNATRGVHFVNTADIDKNE